MKQLLLFVVLFVVSWSQVSAAELNRQLLDDFPGTYEAQTSLLFSNPEKEHGVHRPYYTFETPVYVNDNRTEAVGRAIQSFPTKVLTTVIDAGATGHSVVQGSHALISYAMTWHNLHKEFVVRLIDQDDTSIHSLRYNTDGIVGDIFEVPEFETRTQGASLGVGNSLVATITMKKADSHPFDKIPTYDDHWATLKAAEVRSSEPDLEDSPANGVGITILVLFVCGFICLAIYYTACRRKPSGGQGAVALPEKSLYKRVQTRVIF